MKRRIISIFLVILIVLSMFPVTVSASDFSYVNENNEIKTAESCTAITQDSKNLSDGWYIVESDVTISSRLGISGTVNLIIADGATLTVSGISLNIGNTLKIYAQEQGTGELVSTSSADRAAGIGGDYGYSNLVGNSGGDLYVYGGNIVATGGVGGAGIGGGASKINVAMDGKDGLEGGDGGNVYIYGGTVTATGGAGASGIGGGAGNDGNANSSTKVGGAGGRGGNGGNVYIYGGTVTAIGGEGAADIGGGKGGNGGNGGNFTLDYSSGYTPPGNGGDGGNGGAGGSVTLSGSTAKINASIGGGNGGSGGEPGQETAGTVVSFVRPGSAGTAGQSSVLLIADSATTPEGIDENAMVIQLITDGNGTIQIAYDASSSTVSFTPKPNKGYAFDSYDSSSLTVENHQVSFVAGNHTLSAKFTKKPHSHDEIVYTKISQSMLDSGSFSSGYYYLDENLDASNMIKIPEGANVTICLNDEVLNMGQWNYFDVASGAALTICDCQENQGEITAGINAVVSKGTFTVSGGTLTANTPISNSGICTVEGTAVINGIHTVAEALNNSGELHLSGGSVTAKSGAVYSSGGKIYLSGKVSLSGGEKDLNIVKNTEIYSHKVDDVNDFYIGDELTLSLPTDSFSEGYVVIKEVNDTNKNLFTLTNLNEFILISESGNLVLHKHFWISEETAEETDICPKCNAIKINENNFPDSNFRKWIVENIAGADNEVLETNELAAVTSINIIGFNVRNLTGIELFPNLTEIKCDIDIIWYTVSFDLEAFGLDINKVTVQSGGQIGLLNEKTVLLIDEGATSVVGTYSLYDSKEPVSLTMNVPNPHSHKYEEVVWFDFVVTPATCTTGTVYYKSCVCGRANDETFVDTDTAPDNHIGTNDKLVSNNNGTHNIVWSCCGAVVQSDITCIPVDADDTCLTAETCVCGYVITKVCDEHSFVYTKTGDNEITETCQNSGCEKSATATVQVPQNAVYDGEKKIATVTYGEGWSGGELTVAYSGTANDGTDYSLSVPVKAGNVTASVTVGSATVSENYIIDRATPNVGIVTVESPEIIYPNTEQNSVILKRTDESVRGTISLVNAQFSLTNSSEYDWIFTPDDLANYNKVTGKVIIRVTKLTPTADIFDFTPPTNHNACDGLAKEADVTVKEGIMGVGSVTIKYFEGETELDGAPTTAGTYTVKIVVAEGHDYLKSDAPITDESWTFTFDIIDEADHTDVEIISNGNGTHNKVCTVCEKVLESGIACSYTIPQKDSTDHWNMCSGCGAIDTKVKHNAIDDGNCTTEEKCSCGTIVIEAKSHEFDNICDANCNNKGCTYTREISHTPEADDGDCTTELICVVCQETLVEANKAHSFTNKASSQLVSLADCQNKAVYKLQCDNCNVVSDTLTVEVGDLGNHNWDTKWTNDENAHWHECLVEGCDEINDNDTHYSTGDNIATYLKKAKCDACQIEYGEVVPDKILPIGMITVGTNKWLSFLNSVTFGLFFNETQSVEILAEDNETGVSKVEYYITDSELSGDEVKAITNWNEYTGKFNIEPENKYVIYAKVTDNSGNVIYINTDGIVIDSIAPVVSGIENKKTYCQAVEVSVSDDNLKNVTVNGTEVTLTDGKLTVNPAENEQVIVAEDFAGNKTTYTIKVNDGHTLFYSAFNESIAEICEYCNHFAVAVIKMDKTTYTYNGNPVNAYIEYSGNEFLDGNNLTVYYTQLVDERYEVINSAPVNVGKYRACFDIGNKTAKLNFIIEKQEITAPAIESKVFTGSEQIADIAENSLYDVKVNNGGTNVGKYDVVLSLTDSENYKWETTDETEITVKFTISPKALKQSDFYIPVTEYKYTGSENRPDVVPAIGTFLYTGDFRTEYRNNINVGTAKIIITGVGNYSGVVEYSFEIVKAEQNAPTGFIVLDESYALDADGQINGVNTDMEYRKDGETQYIEINSNVLPNLTPGKYYIRYKEKSNYNPSEDTEIVINPGEKRTSSVEITAELDKTYDGNPASLENEYKYYGDGEISVKWYADVNGERGEEISAPVNAGTYWVGVNAAETDRYNPANGYKQFIISKAVKDPTEQNIQGIVNGYTEDKSGVISGVTPEMEYRKEGETAYTPVTGNEITDLENGTYYIRYAGDENHNPSDEIKVVIQAPDCDCKCHSENPFMQFINKVFYAICNFFGVNRHCCCDATHYDSYMWKPITDLFKK